jgi:hypothetical protein
VDDRTAIARLLSLWLNRARAEDDFARRVQISDLVTPINILWVKQNNALAEFDLEERIEQIPPAPRSNNDNVIDFRSRALLRALKRLPNSAGTIRQSV